MNIEWNIQDSPTPIIQVPLQFTLPIVDALAKQLVRLNSPYSFRIVYLGPRWQNTLLYLKKYQLSHLWNQGKHIKAVNSIKNSFANHQFYKNQIYYRAFEGMNPTLNQQSQLLFESRFESGNLDCAVKVKEDQYDLFMRVDSNTRGHLFWFYFSIRNCKKGKKIKFNICNFNKRIVHYEQGFHPFMFSTSTQQWSQLGTQNITFYKKNLRYDFLDERIKMRQFYQLSFEVVLNDEQEIKFAYSIPYTYSDLLIDLKQLENQAQISNQGRSLAGINIPLIIIGKNQQGINKKILLATGRIHPSQTNSSIMISQFMKHICLSPQSKWLRNKMIIIIIPMINPDGVILGNSRTSASGRDLNRQFRHKDSTLFPEVSLLKQFVAKINQTYQLDMYLDFHGHSCKKNMFVFGPNYNISQSEYYKCRVIPKILANRTNVFRYYSCSYDIPFQKRGTARAVMLEQFNVSLFYTIETSLGFYRDQKDKTVLTFSVQKWLSLGKIIAQTVQQYYQNIEQYEQFIQSKRKNKKIYQQFTLQKKRKDRRDDCELNLFKLFEQIKLLQEKGKREVSKKQNIDSDFEDSDSNDQQDNLDNQKTSKLNDMIKHFQQASCMKQKNKKQTKINDQFTKKYSKKQFDTKIVREQIRRQQEIFLNEILTSIQAKNQAKNNKCSHNLKKTHQNQKYRMQSKNACREKMISQTLNFVNQITDADDSKQQLQCVCSRQFLQQRKQMINEKVTRMKVRMFNFNKVVPTSHSKRYKDKKQYLKLKDIVSSKQENKYHSIKRKTQNINSQTIDTSIKLENIFMSSPIILNIDSLHNNQLQKQLKNCSFQNQSYHKINQHKGMIQLKSKASLPSSFYRIKERIVQRKGEEMNELQLQRAIHYKSLLNYSENRNSIKTISNDRKYMKTSKKQGNFVRIRGFPII